jgi:hypothetical protein
VTKQPPATYKWCMRGALVAVTLLLALGLGGAYAAGAFGGSTPRNSMPGPSRPPSLQTDLRLAKSVPCRGSYYRHPVGPKVFSRFHAVTAVICVEGSRTYPGQGQWEVISRKVAVSGIPNWQRYFEQPNDPNFPPKNAGCTANYVGIFVPVFIDSQGHALVPRTPLDRCGHPLGLAPGEKRIRVRWHTVRVRRIRQTISAPAVAANCPMRWGNVVAEGEPKLRPDESFFTPTPHTARACIYRAPADHIALGYFVRGKRLGPAQTQRLLGAITGSPTSRRCAKQRTFAMILAKGSNLGASVELGGCWRVAPGLRGRKPDTADPSAIRAILGVH